MIRHTHHDHVDMFPPTLQSGVSVTMSPQFQIVIPPAFRQSLGLQPGQQLQLIQYKNRLVLVPFKPMPQYRGFLKGIDTTVHREGDRV